MIECATWPLVSNSQMQSQFIELYVIMTIQVHVIAFLAIYARHCTLSVSFECPDITETFEPVSMNPKSFNKHCFPLGI